MPMKNPIRHLLNKISKYQRLSLQYKVLLVITVTMTILLTLLCFIIIRSVQSSTEEQAIDQLVNISTLHSNEVRYELEQSLAIANTLARTVERVGYSETQPYNDALTESYRDVLRSDADIVALWDSRYLPALVPDKYRSGHLLNLVWRENNLIKQAVDTNGLYGNSATYQQLLIENSNGILEPYFETFGGVQKAHPTLITSVYAPIHNLNNQVAGFIGIDIKLEFLNALVQRIQPYKNSYTFIISNSFKYIAHPNTDLLGRNAQEHYGDIFTNNGVLDYITNGGHITFEDMDVYGERSYFTVHPIVVGGSNTTLSMVTVVPCKEVTHQTTSLLFRAMLLGILAIIIMMGIFYYMLRSYLLKPMLNITHELQKLSEGHIDASGLATTEVQQNSDEIGRMSISLRRLVNGLTKKMNFSKEVGAGNYDITLELLGPNDVLGREMIAMCDSLRASRDEELKRKADDDQRRWFNEGLNRLSEVLRAGGNSLQSFSANIVREMVNYLEANQGGLFVLNEDNANGTTTLDLMAAYAYSRQKFIEKTIFIGEGLVGTCAVEQQTVHLTEIPNDYIAISSGLGDAKPRSLLIVPLVSDNKTIGVIELASFTQFSSQHVEFAETSAASIAQTLATARTAQRTSDLLARTQQQAEEMKAQEEELRQNMEELEAIKEEVEKQNDIIMANQAELEQEQMLLNAILDNLPEKLVFKDNQSRYICVSTSAIKGLGLSNQQDIKGKTDFDLFDPDEAQANLDLEQRILRTSIPLIGQESERKVNGRSEWEITTQQPLRNSYGEVVGLFSYSHNITPRKRLEAEIEDLKRITAEEQQRARTIENDKQYLANALYSSTLVGEYTPDGYMTFINQPYAQLLGIEASEVMGKHHSYLMDFTDEQQRAYNEFWRDLNRGNSRVQEQRCTVNGRQFLFHETYTPVFDENAKVCKIIKIATDISHLLQQEEP